MKNFSSSYNHVKHCISAEGSHVFQLSAKSDKVPLAKFPFRMVLVFIVSQLSTVCLLPFDLAPQTLPSSEMTHVHNKAHHVLYCAFYFVRNNSGGAR